MPNDGIPPTHAQSPEPSTSEYSEVVNWWPHDFMDTDWRVFGGTASARRLEILEKSGGACWYCGAEIEATTMHIDHLIPLKMGGPNTYRNSVPACPTCNMSKGSKSLEDWRIKAGRKYSDIDMPWFSQAQREWLESQGFEFPPIPYVVFWFELQGLEP